MKIPFVLSAQKDFYILSITVIPQAKETALVEVNEAGILKIKLKAIPEKWKANKVLIEFLSEIFWVKKSQVEIISGETSPLKKLKFPLSVQKSE